MFAGCCGGNSNIRDSWLWRCSSLSFLNLLWFRSGDYRTLLQTSGTSCAALLPLHPFFTSEIDLFCSPIYPRPPVLLRFLYRSGLLARRSARAYYTCGLQRPLAWPGRLEICSFTCQNRTGTPQFWRCRRIGLAPLAVGPDWFDCVRRYRFGEKPCLFALRVDSHLVRDVAGVALPDSCLFIAGTFCVLGLQTFVRN